MPQRRKPAKPAANGSRSKRVVDQWMRDIRTAARNWAHEYRPKMDMTPIAEVRDALYTYLLETHPDLIDQVFVTPLYTPVCTWHIIGRDVKKPLEDRGFVFVPNRLDKNDNQFARRDVLFRQATPADEPEYIELEHDLLGALLDRQERLVSNAAGRAEQTRARRERLQLWAQESRTKNRA